MIDDMVMKAQHGDAEAMSDLYQFHKQRVFAVCLRMTQNREEAEDLTQDVFMRVFQTIRQFKGESQFSSWLTRVAINTVLMSFRPTRRALPTVSMDNVISNVDDETYERYFGSRDVALEGVVDRITLDKAINQLSPGCREILALRVDGLMHREIAKVYGCSLGNAKSQVFRAKYQLRKILNKGLGRRSLCRQSGFSCSAPQ